MPLSLLMFVIGAGLPLPAIADPMPMAYTARVYLTA